MGNLIDDPDRELLASLVENEILEFYDDPGGESVSDARNWIYKLSSLALRLGINYDKLIQTQTTDFEQRRMNVICNPIVMEWKEVNAVV